MSLAFGTHVISCLPYVCCYIETRRSQMRSSVVSLSRLPYRRACEISPTVRVTGRSAMMTVTSRETDRLLVWYVGFHPPPRSHRLRPRHYCHGVSAFCNPFDGLHWRRHCLLIISSSSSSYIRIKRVDKTQPNTVR